MNTHGEKILVLCRTFNLMILNCRTLGDPLGAFTYCDPNLGSSTIDYGICNQTFYSNIKNFLILPQNELSDHCKIVTELMMSCPRKPQICDNYDWIKPDPKFRWDKNNISTVELEKIAKRINAGLKVLEENFKQFIQCPPRTHLIKLRRIRNNNSKNGSTRIA